MTRTNIEDVQLLHELKDLRTYTADLEARQNELERAEEALRLRNKELELLNRASQVFVSSLNLEQVFQAVLERVRYALGVVGCSTWVVDEHTGELVCRYVTDPKRETILGWRLARGQGIAGWVLEQGQSLIVADTRRDARHFKDVDRRTGLESRSILAVPLRSKGAVIGVIEIVDAQASRFSSTDQRLVEAMAPVASIAIQNARLFEETDRLRRFNQDIVDCVAEGILIQDALGYITFANPKLAAFLGWTTETLVGRHSSEILLSFDATEFTQINVSCRDGRAAEFETTLISRQGKQIPVLIHACRLMHSENPASTTGELGSPDGLLCAVTDLTNHKRIENRLRQAAKMESVGRLSAGIAHDFNNLLTSINGFAELMVTRMPTEDPMHDMASKILRSGQRAARLVRQLLAFSQRQIIIPRSLDVNDVLRNANEALQQEIGDKIELKMNLGSHLWPVRADPRQIEDVVISLARNAHTAMPGGGHLVLETANAFLGGDSLEDLPEAAPGDYVVLKICDSSNGMDEETREHIFEPFYVTSANVADGTGLRLAAVYGIVKQNRGHILVQSGEKKGTTFTIYLPRAVEEPEEK